ncbi:hypothetical protein CWS01_07755 [Niallia nealsonii]|uniref:DNA polymerase I n=2 Tax=Niallia nealsonii TaxID=115979 RepID=A0A2N0Z434_9BACI|nr:hypothetical protein CWS01_07755 [Niallia nealsonii]
MIRLISWADQNGCYVSESIDDIKELLENPEVLKVFHNALFDVTWLLAKGINVQTYTDTKVLSQIINNRISKDNSLEILSLKHFGILLDKSLQSENNWNGKITNEHKEYAKRDAEVTYKLYFRLLQIIEESSLEEVMLREISALPAVIEMQLYGMLFDYTGWKKELKKMKNEKNAIEEEIRSIFEHPTLNLQSPLQVKEALSTIGITVESTSEGALASLEDQHQVIVLLRKYKKLQKRLSSFGEKLKERMGSEGRIRGSWNVIGTNTGRMSCVKPNLQGLPSLAKTYVKASKDHLLLIADYSQIELRVMAQMAQDKVMMESFQNGVDLHLNTASEIMGKPIILVSSDERKIAKTTNFGLLYGMTVYGLQKRINAAFGLDVSYETANLYRNGYFNLYKQVRSFQDAALKADLIETMGGRVWTNIPKGDIRRLNYPIQGTSAEGLKEALAIFYDKKDPNWRIIAAIHDEIVVEVPKEDVLVAKDRLIKAMKLGMSYFITDVPIEVDIDISEFWKK